MASYFIETIVTDEDMKPRPACYGAVPIGAISSLSVIAAGGADMDVSSTGRPRRYIHQICY